MMKIFEASPMPNHRIASGKIAKGEIGRSSSTSGSRMASQSRERAMVAPSVTPAMAAMAKPATMR